MAPKVLNKHRDRLPLHAVYIGRGSPWGNPFVIDLIKGINRADVMEAYKRYLDANPELLRRAKLELRGHDLVCFCAPLPCHGDILLEVVN